MSQAPPGPRDGNLPLVGGIETGGTKIVCAIGTGPADLRAIVEFPTADPELTLRRAIDFFLSHASRSPSIAGAPGAAPTRSST